MLRPDGVCQRAVGALMKAELTCRELVEFLDDYLSGQLHSGRREAFDSHLAECPSCERYTRTYLAAMRIVRLAVGCGRDPVPDDVPEELVQAVLSARGRAS